MSGVFRGAGNWSRRRGRRGGRGGVRGRVGGGWRGGGVPRRGCRRGSGVGFRVVVVVGFEGLRLGLRLGLERLGGGFLRWWCRRRLGWFCCVYLVRLRVRLLREERHGDLVAAEYRIDSGVFSVKVHSTSLHSWASRLCSQRSRTDFLETSLFRT